MIQSYFPPLQELRFAYPLAFILPLAIAFVFLLHRKPGRAILFPQIQPLKELPRSWRIYLRGPTLFTFGAGFIALLTLAAARPQRVTAVVQPQKSRNIMLALDISRSMATGDFGGDFGKMSRLRGVKVVVSEFIKNRTSDRLGLVVFGSNTYLQSPLTLDHGVVQQLVGLLQVGLAGDGTAIGDGLGLSLKRVQDFEGDSRAVILMTDGVSNAGQVNPIKAAKVARDLGIKVHTIGIGSQKSNMINFPGGFSMPSAAGVPEFDEKTLREIADITGGVYFNAENISGLKEIYDEIDKLEQTERDEGAREVVEEFFFGYAALGLLCYLCYLVFARTVFLKIP